MGVRAGDADVECGLQGRPAHHHGVEPRRRGIDAECGADVHRQRLGQLGHDGLEVITLGREAVVGAVGRGDESVECDGDVVDQLAHATLLRSAAGACPDGPRFLLSFQATESVFVTEH